MNLPGDGSSAGAGIGCREPARRFDRWAASYEVSQLQHVLYGPVHDAVLRYARRHVPHPGVILDVGCGTGRLSARLAVVYRQARVVGVDASTAMIRNAVTVPVVHRTRFAASVAEQLPFAEAVFDLVLATLSVSHWSDKVAGLAEISRVMAPDAILVAADVCSTRGFRPMIGWSRRGRFRFPDELPVLISAGGLRVEHIEPIRSVASIADAALIAARTGRRHRDPWSGNPGSERPAGSAGSQSIRVRGQRESRNRLTGSALSSIRRLRWRPGRWRQPETK